MKKNLMIVTLPLLLSFLAVSAYAQGPKGPSGSGAQSAEKQAESTRPDALSGKAGTPRPDHDETNPASSTHGTAMPPPSPATPDAGEDTRDKQDSPSSQAPSTAKQDEK